jgi:hypothetical protein
MREGVVGAGYMILASLPIPQSFSGSPLDLYNRKVRLAYLDEAGISNSEHEPYLVVAGVIINADQDWRPLQRHLQSIGRRFLPSEHALRLVFHAKDIWHGSGYFDRRHWSRSKREELFAALAEIPRRFHLPIVAGFVQRKPALAYARDRIANVPERDVTMAVHALAFSRAVGQIDTWMKLYAPAEFVMLLAENAGKMQSIIKSVHAGYVNDGSYDPNLAPMFTADTVIDTVHFAGKNESALLQIADLCSFTIKRHLMGRADIADCFAMMREQIVAPLDQNEWASF